MSTGTAGGGVPFEDMYKLCKSSVSDTNVCFVIDMVFFVFGAAPPTPCVRRRSVLAFVFAFIDLSDPASAFRGTEVSPFRLSGHPRFRLPFVRSLWLRYGMRI